VAVEIPNQIPKSVIAGDTWQWYFATPDYLASESWVLTYRFRSLELTTNKARFDDTGVSREHIVKDITGTVSGDQWLVTVAAASSAWDAGRWAFSARVSKALEAYTVDSGYLVVEPDFASLTTSFDSRSNARVIVDRIDTAIASGATRGTIAAYGVDGKTMTYRNMGELLQLRSYYAGIADAEEGNGGIQTFLGVFR
jgi:hypothetical protein